MSNLRAIIAAALWTVAVAGGSGSGGFSGDGGIVVPAPTSSSTFGPEPDIPQPEYGFTQLEYSVYESRRSTLTFCLQVTGSIPQTDTANLTILTRTNGTANHDIDYMTFSANVTLEPDQATSCLSLNSLDIIHDDTLLEFTEYFEVIAVPPDPNFEGFEGGASVQPFSTATIFIADNEIVQVGFDSSVYSVSEGDGEVVVSVRWLGNGVELGRPISVRVSSSGGNATAGSDYDDQGVLPQIAYLEARSSPSQTWDISIPIIDDSDIEGPESFTLYIFSGDVSVSLMPDTATVIIADNDGEPSPDLEVFFTGDTPMITSPPGSDFRIAFQVETNKPASVRCRLVRDRGLNIPCTTGETSTTGELESGTYSIRVIARAGLERATSTVSVIIPDDFETCTFHLVNRGITVSGDNATIEFGGIILDGRCQLNDEQPTPCTSPVVLNGLSAGLHQFHLTAEGCGDVIPRSFIFTV